MSILESFFMQIEGDCNEEAVISALVAILAQDNVNGKIDVMPLLVKHLTCSVSAEKVYEAAEAALAYAADAEVVQLQCPSCGHTWRSIKGDPVDRESDEVCPQCGDYFVEYGRLVRKREALIVSTSVIYMNGEVKEI